MSAHTWPGNVRELRNVMERALLLAGEATALEATHVVFDEPPAAEPGGASLSPEETAERDRIMEALAACGGNQSRAAKQLGMARSTLVTKLSILRIPRPRK